MGLITHMLLVLKDTKLVFNSLDDFDSESWKSKPYSELFDNIKTRFNDFMSDADVYSAYRKLQELLLAELMLARKIRANGDTVALDYVVTDTPKLKDKKEEK